MTESTIGMTSLKDIAAGVVAHHDLLECGTNKENLQQPTSDHQTINMRRMYMYNVHVRVFMNDTFVTCSSCWSTTCT